MAFLGHDSDDEAPSGRRGGPAFVRQVADGSSANVNPLAVAPAAVPFSPTNGNINKSDIDHDLSRAVALSLALVKPSKFLVLPEDLLIQITEFLWGSDLFAIRRINVRFAAFWARHAYDRFRPLLTPSPGTWCRRGEDSGSKAVATLKTATKQQLEDLRGFSRVTRVVTAAAKWLKDGVQIPREVRFGHLTLNLQGDGSPIADRARPFPDAEVNNTTDPAVAATAATTAAMEDEEMTQHRSIPMPDEREDGEVNGSGRPGLANSFEEPSNSEQQSVPAMVRSGSGRSSVVAGSAPAGDGFGSFHNMTTLVSPARPRRPNSRDEDPKLIAKRKERRLKKWMAEMRRYWLCRRNIFHGLCNFTALERHSHATPVLLPNGSVCFSRWQMLSCFVRFEEHFRPPVENEWGVHGERGRKRRTPKCEGDPATSAWARTGHIASHRDTITVIKYHAPSETILTASLDGSIKMWKPRSVNEAPAQSHNVGHRRPHAKGSRPRSDESSSSDTDDDIDVHQAQNNEEYQSCGEPPVLSFALNEDDPENQRDRADDATWLTCISTFDVPSEALSIPRCGVFSVDILEMEGFFGERCLAPLLAVGMESGHIVIVWCTPAPDEWQVIDVHYTGDLRAQAIRFMNHVPFAPSFLMAREAKKAAATAAGASSPEAAAVSSFMQFVADAAAAANNGGDAESPPATPVTPEGTLASVPIDPCHPYSIRQVTSTQYAEHDRAVQHSDMFEQLARSEDGVDGSVDDGVSSTRQQKSSPPEIAATPSDYFLETGVVHVAVITLSAVMVIEFQLNRSIELLGFDEFSELTPLQQRVLRHVRTDGMSNGCLIPRRRKADRIRPAKYVLSPCDVSSVTRLFGMSVNDIVGFDVPTLCHSMQFPIFPCLKPARPEQRPQGGGWDQTQLMTPIVGPVTLEERRIARMTSFTGPDDESTGAAAPTSEDPNHEPPAAAVALAPPADPNVAAPARSTSTAVGADASVDVAVPRSTTNDSLPRTRSGIRALPAFAPLDRDDESSASTTRAQFPQSVCAPSGMAPVAPSRPVFTFGDARISTAPWQGNPFFLAPTVALVTSEGRLVLITKRSSTAPRDLEGSTTLRASKTYRLDTLYPHSTAQFTCCRISPCSGIIATGYEDGVLRLYLRVACISNPSDARGSFTNLARPHPHASLFPHSDDPSNMFGPVYEVDSMVRHIAGMVSAPAMSGTGLTDGMVSVRLFPTHRGSVCSVHLDSWKLTSVDALSTVYVIDLRTFQLLWVVSQRPRPFAASSATWRDRTVALDSMSHSYVLRQVQWLNESLLVSPLGVTKHAFVAHFGGKFKKDSLPERTHPAIANADVTVGDSDSHDWMSLVRHRISAIAFQSRAAAQFHRSRLADAVRQAAQMNGASPDVGATGTSVNVSAAAPPAMSNGDASCVGSEMRPDDDWDVADSTQAGKFALVSDTNPYNALLLPFSPSATLRDQAKPLRVFFAEPHGLSSHVLHIVGFPMTLLMIATFATLVCLRLDGFIQVDWWIIMIPHMIMWPDYTALNYFAYNPRALQHSGFAFIARVFVDFLYVVMFPVLYVCRMNGYFSPELQSTSWIYLSLPLNLSVLLNVVAAFVERNRDTNFRLQATDSTPSSRAVIGAIDVIQATMAVWLITLVSAYFDGPPIDPTAVGAADNSSSGLSIFLAVLPLWIAIAVVIVIIPKMPAFNRAVVTAKMFAALASCYLGVLIFLITPLVLFCLKYNNYYSYVHAGSNQAATPAPGAASTTTPGPTSAPVTSTSTISALGSLSLTLIMSPLLVLLLIAHVLAVSNVVGHYNRLMRGYSRRGR